MKLLPHLSAVVISPQGSYKMAPMKIEISPSLYFPKIEVQSTYKKGTIPCP